MRNSLKTKGDAIAEIGTEHTAVWMWENSFIFREKKRNHTSTLTIWFLPWVPKKGSNFVWPHYKECYVGLSCHVNPNLSKKEKLPAGAKFRKNDGKECAWPFGVSNVPFRFWAWFPSSQKMLCWIALSNDSNLYSSSHHCHSYSQLHTFMSKKGNNPGNGMGS